MSHAGSKLPAKLRQFLERETVCSLAVALPSGDIHIAPLLFYCDPDTLTIYMSTAHDTEKMTWYRKGDKVVRAGIAIGVSKKLPYLVQMRGELRVFDHKSDDSIYQAYMKRAHQLDDPRSPKNVMIMLRPTWVRYSDWGDFTKELILV